MAKPLRAVVADISLCLSEHFETFGEPMPLDACSRLFTRSLSRHLGAGYSFGQFVELLRERGLIRVLKTIRGGRWIMLESDWQELDKATQEALVEWAKMAKTPSYDKTASEKSFAAWLKDRHHTAS